MNLQFFQANPGSQNLFGYGHKLWPSNRSLSPENTLAMLYQRFLVGPWRARHPRSQATSQICNLVAAVGLLPTFMAAPDSFCCGWGYYGIEVFYDGVSDAIWRTALDYHVEFHLFRLKPVGVRYGCRRNGIRGG